MLGLDGFLGFDKVWTNFSTLVRSIQYIFWYVYRVRTYTVNPCIHGLMNIVVCDFVWACIVPFHEVYIAIYWLTYVSCWWQGRSEKKDLFFILIQVISSNDKLFKNVRWTKWFNTSVNCISCWNIGFYWIYSLLTVLSFLWLLLFSEITKIFRHDK